MKAVIVDVFNNYETRTKYVYNELVSLGYETTYIVSDFSHSAKSKIVESRDNTLYVETKPYKKNLSLKRILSHLNFSKKVKKLLFELRPDLIYCLIPLNSLAKAVCKYKAANNNIDIYFDIFDCWPESLPLCNFIKNIFFIWRNMRDKYICQANKVFMECSYYEKFLPKKINGEVAYLCKKERDINYSYNNEELTFLYLGSINSIIDIFAIVNFLDLVQQKRKVKLVIIGGGESESIFMQELSRRNITYTNCGKIFDDNEKDQIISKCQFGINIYKKGLSIGLTMKSVDYFCRGLPIISANIYDTFKIISEMHCGIDLTDNSFDKISIIQNLDQEQWLQFNENTKKAYRNYFTEENFTNILKRNLKNNR